MQKSFFIYLGILLFSISHLLAQGDPPPGISAIKARLSESRSDSQRVSHILEASLFYILKPGTEKNDYDSALNFLDQAMGLSNHLPEDKWKARCFSVYSLFYREKNQKETGKSYIEKAIAIFLHLDLKEDLANAYMELQTYYDVYSDSEWKLKIKYAEEAERLYKESGNKLKQANTIKELGDFYSINDNDSIALDLLQKALVIYKSINYEKVQGVYDLIGDIYTYHKEYQQALKYGLLAVQTSEKFRTGGIEQSTIYNRVGLTYYRLGQYNEAVNYFSRSFPIALEYKDSMAAKSIGQNAVNSWLRLKKQKELLDFLQHHRPLWERGERRDKAAYLCSYILAYLLTGNHQKASPFVGQLIRLVGNDSNIYLLRSLHRSVIPYYLAAGQFKEMYKYLPANEAICKKAGVTSNDLPDNYLWWYKADSALGNQSASIAHYKLYKEASDSLMRFTANQQINQLMVQHETLKKDQEIISKENNIRLLTQQDLLQKNKLQQGAVIRNITLAVVALLVIIMVLLYSRYRLKQKTNKKLELQQDRITKQNHSLQHLLNEKEWLLKEIHHRVKNNLQIVMSLLNSQSAYINNDAALTAIQDSQHRVHAMSLIHQKLYGSENVSSINMSIYIRELVSYLGDSFDAGKRIRFELNIEELEMDVSQAVPLGLILNEAITNSIKYAFPDDRSGLVSISLSNTTFNHYLLTISDNGIGMPVEFTKTGSLGMSLMKGLSEDLDGSFSIETRNGTTVKVSFAHDTVVKKHNLLEESFISNN
jgi:two-component sensor histidine kinase